MSDRTHFQIRIASCPDDGLQALHDIVREHIDLTDNDVIEFGEVYEVEEVVCGRSREIAAALQEAVPASSWECWEDPKYIRLGRLFRYTPELGLWSHQCNADGEPVFSVDEVLDLAENTTDPESRRLALGVTHQAALKSLNTQPAYSSTSPIDPSTAKTDEPYVVQFRDELADDPGEPVRTYAALRAVDGLWDVAGVSRWRYRDDELIVLRPVRNNEGTTS